jgi:hypothetical protein
MDEAGRLPGEQHLEQANPLTEAYARERATKPYQCRPENNAGKVFVSEEDQPEPRQERQREPRHISHLSMHLGPEPAASGVQGGRAQKWVHVPPDDDRPDTLLHEPDKQ